MNRELIDVLFKSFGGSDKEQVTRTKVGSDPEEVAMVCDGISKCVIIPVTEWLYHNVNIKLENLLKS